MGIVKIRTFLINSIFLKLKIELRDAQRYRTLVLRRWFPRTWMCVSLHSLRRSSHLTGSSRNHLCDEGIHVCFPPCFPLWSLGTGVRRRPPRQPTPAARLPSAGTAGLVSSHVEPMNAAPSRVHTRPGRCSGCVPFCRAVAAQWTPASLMQNARGVCGTSPRSLPVASPTNLDPCSEGANSRCRQRMRRLPKTEERLLDAAAGGS